MDEFQRCENCIGQSGSADLCKLCRPKPNNVIQLEKRARQARIRQRARIFDRLLEQAHKLP